MTEGDRILQTKEKYYKRNYIALLLDGFFFSFSLSIFSHTTVLPVYISHLTDNKIYVSLLAVIYFGLVNASSIFSCVIGMNTKSAKWSTVIVCFTQRFGLFLMTMTTLLAKDNPSLSLTLFMLSYILFSTSAGMSSPVFSNMVSKVIHKNISNFYGSYTVAGAISGVVGSQILKAVLEKYEFPNSYTIIFFLGVIFSLFSTMSLAFLIKEVEEPSRREKFKISDLPKEVRFAIKENKPYRDFLAVKILASIAEMSILFYIVKISSVNNRGEGFIGTMGAILLTYNIISSKILGAIGERKGINTTLKIATFSGIIASIITVFANTPEYGFIIYLFVSISNIGVDLSTKVAIIEHSDSDSIPIYTTITGIVVAPFYAIFGILGGIIVDKFSLNAIFIISSLFYLLAFLKQRSIKEIYVTVPE